jgi:inner membrane protein
MDMMGRTHLAIALFFVLLFMGSMPNKLVFVPVALIAAILPDIDNANSKIGSHRVMRLLQFFVRHRGVIHSFTLCILISVLFAFFIPMLAFPFFLGYSLHLLADSFTIEGIQPFWPWSRSVNGMIHTGAYTEKAIFFVFIGLDVLALAAIFL